MEIVFVPETTSNSQSSRLIFTYIGTYVHTLHTRIEELAAGGLWSVSLVSIFPHFTSRWSGLGSVGWR